LLRKNTHRKSEWRDQRTDTESGPETEALKGFQNMVACRFSQGLCTLKVLAAVLMVITSSSVSCSLLLEILFWFYFWTYNPMSAIEFPSGS